MLGFDAVGRFALGQVSSPYIVTTLTAEAGTFALNGQAALFATTMVFDFGAFTLSGQAVDLTQIYPSDFGSFTLTGQDNLMLPSLEAGSFTLTGQDVTFSPLTVQSTRRPLYRRGSSYWKGVS